MANNQSYDFNLSVGIQELLDQDSKAKVEGEITKQKEKIEEPVKIKLSIDDAKKQLSELEKESKKIQRSLAKAINSNNYSQMSSLSSQMSFNQREIQRFTEYLTKQGIAVSDIGESVDNTVNKVKRNAKELSNTIEKTNNSLDNSKTIKSMDDLEKRYFSIIGTVEKYLQLVEKLNKVSGNNSRDLRKQVIDFANEMPQDVAGMLGERFVQQLANGFKGISTKDIIKAITAPSNANAFGALQHKLDLAKSIDFNNIKYTDDGSIKLSDSDNPFEFLKSIEGQLPIVNELYEVLDNIATAKKELGTSGTIEAIKQETEATEKLAKAKKKASNIKVREFTQEEYDARAEKYEQENDGNVESLENTVDIIRQASQFGTKFAADMQTSCKRAATAVNRFFSAIDPNKYPAIASWKDTILESVQNGVFSEKEMYNGMFTGAYSWGVEAPDEDNYYVYLNLLDVAKDKEKEYSAYLQEEYKKRDEGLEKQDELTRKLIQTYEKLNELHANEPNFDNNNQIESIKKRLTYYEQEKVLLQDIQNIKEEFNSIPSRYKNPKEFNETARVFQSTLKFGDYGHGNLQDNERATSIYQRELEGAIKKQEKLTAAVRETGQAREQEADETEKATDAKTKYYEIDEKAAKLAKQMRSFDDYKEGSATASYKAAIDEMAKIVEEKKTQFPDKSDKLDQWLDRYAKNLATYINRDNQIGAQYPSVMISGAGNYNVNKHNRQMASWGKNYQYYDDNVLAIANKIKNLGSAGTNVIRSDESDALEKLEARLEYMKYWHDVMVEVNKYYRKNKTLEGFEGVEPDELERIKKDLATIKQVGMYDVPYPQYAISNDNQNIKRIEGRITELKRLKDNEGLKEENDIYKLWTDKQDMRIRISFEMGKPDQEIIDMLRGKSFKWSPKNNAWQRQLTGNAVYDTKRLQESLHKYYKIDTSNTDAVQQQEQLASAVQETADAREQETRIISLLHEKYSELRKLYDTGDLLQNDSDVDDVVKNINEIIENLEKQKAVEEEIISLNKELLAIPDQYKNGTKIDSYKEYGINSVNDTFVSMTLEEINDYKERLKIEQESAKNVVQLVDNYGQSLDKVNNKLMQGVKLLNEQGQVIRLFHNSPNIFDVFDSRKSGTNQGQALGFGHYLALQQNGEFNNTDYGRYQTQWYANVQNAFKVGDKISPDQAASIIDKFLADRAEGFKQHMLSKLLDGDVVEAVKDIASISKTIVGEIFGSIGYDAIMDGAQINVFDRSKIHRANNSVLDIGSQEFIDLNELQKKIWEQQSIIERANSQIKELSNQYIGKTEDELEFSLFIETMTKSLGWRQNVAKIASAFKELTGKLPKSDDISEESMQAMVENYEFSKQNLQEYQEAVATHQATVNELTAKFDSQKAVTDAITQSYINGDIKGVVNKEIVESTVKEQELAAAAERATDAEERKAEAACETRKQLEGQKNAQSEISAEAIIERDIEQALSQLRTAKDNETTLINLKGVFSGDDLVEQFSSMVQKIAEQANLSVGKITVKDDIAQVRLYNEELKVTVDQIYQLKQATEEADSAQLELVSQSFSQNVKALNENSFDIDGFRARATAAVEKVRSSLHGLEYDLTDLEKAAGNISSKEDFAKFNNQLKAAQDNIQAIKNATVSQSSMNQLANMQRDMKNANIELETMRIKLQKIGDIDGVEDAKKMIDDMAASAQKFNEAQDAQAQQQAYSDYSDTRSSFKAQMEYLNAVKSLNASQASAAKQTDPIKEQYEALLDTVNKINSINSDILKFQEKDAGSGLYSGYIKQLQAGKEQLVLQLQSTIQEIDATLSGGFVQGKEISVPSIKFLDDNGAVASFLNDTKTQASLTAEEIDKLVASLQKAQSIDVQAAAKVTEQFRTVQETYKQITSLSTLDTNSSLYKGVENVFAQIMKYKDMLSSDPTQWTPEQSQNLQTLINKFNEYGNVLVQVGQKEAQYFAGKQKYTTDTSMQSMADDAKKAAEEVSTAQQKLTTAAQKFAEESGASGAIVTNFVQGADGIARLDFSILDSGTNSLRQFKMEMGSVSEGTYITETTVNNFISKAEVAAKQLKSISDLISRLNISGIDMDQSSIEKLVQLQRDLNAELSKGSNADETQLTKLTRDAKISQAEVEKLYKKYIQMQDAIERGDAINLGKIDFSGDIRGQLSNSIKAWADSLGYTDAKIINLNTTTGKFKVTAQATDNTVREFTGDLNKLSSTASMQETSVKNLGSKWDQFKASLSGTAKQFMTAMVGTNVFYKALSELRKGYGYVKEIDLAMTELKKVTDETEASYNKFLQTASKTAGTIGSTVSDFTEATANFARLGYSMDESAKMAETAIVYKNVADGLDTVEESTESIISTMKAFGIESSDTMGIIDRFNEVGVVFADYKVA